MNKQLLEAARAALDALSCTGEPDDPGHRCTHCDDYVDRNGPVRAVLRAALEAAQREQVQTTPPGYRTVPVEPTPEMLRAAQTAWMRDRLQRTTTMWAAMLAAAPDSAALCAHDEEGPR